jgi:hypothetical protein
MVDNARFGKTCDVGDRLKVPDHDVARYRTFSPTYRLAKQEHLAVAASKNCARKAAS